MMDREGLESTNSSGHVRARVRADHRSWMLYSRAHLEMVSWTGRITESRTVGGKIRPAEDRSTWGSVGSRSRKTNHKPGGNDENMDGNRKGRHCNSAGRMKNIWRHSVRGSSIKIIVLDKRVYFSKKKWYGISQSGDRVGPE